MRMLFSVLAHAATIGALLTALSASAQDWQSAVRAEVAGGNLTAASASVARRLQESPGDLEALGWRARLLLFCFLDHLPYRQINLVWRLQGMWQYLRGNVAWEPAERAGFAAHSSQ
jgi:hypothetical protein